MQPEVQQLQAGMRKLGYIAGPSIATSVYLAEKMVKPLLIEGGAGVGKTEIAKVLAQQMGAELIRLQCYQGLDVNTALYEWNYQRQILAIKIWEDEDVSAEEKEQHIFAREFLLERPLLQAITQDRRRFCWSTRSIGPTKSSKPSCSNCCPTFRFRFPNSAPSRRPRCLLWC